jgi:hypothetical protein
MGAQVREHLLDGLAHLIELGLEGLGLRLQVIHDQLELLLELAVPPLAELVLLLVVIEPFRDLLHFLVQICTIEGWLFVARLIVHIETAVGRLPGFHLLEGLAERF